MRRGGQRRVEGSVAEVGEEEGGRRKEERGRRDEEKRRLEEGALAESGVEERSRVWIGWMRKGEEEEGG
jgi:hypothetical protein